MRKEEAYQKPVDGGQCAEGGGQREREETSTRSMSVSAWLQQLRKLPRLPDTRTRGLVAKCSKRKMDTQGVNCQDTCDGAAAGIARRRATNPIGVPR